MANETLTKLAELELPFGRRAIVRAVSYDSGLRLVRLVLREGKRIIQVDLDADAAHDLANWLQTAADRTDAAE